MGLSNLTEEQLRAALVRIRAEREKRYEYNKEYRKRPGVRAKQYARNKVYRERRKAFEREVLKQAAELGLIEKA